MPEPSTTVAEQTKPTRSVLKEILHSYEEFKARVDSNRPIHHRAFSRMFSGLFCRLVFRVYGIDKNNGGIVVFEVHRLFMTLDFEEQESVYRKLVEKYAKPLGSTEGAWTI